MDCSQSPLTHNQRTRLQQLRWLRSHSLTWNIAVTWHFPNSMRRFYGRWDAEWHSNEFRRYLNHVDRKIYKAAHKNRGLRLPRLIMLEQEEGVGWHIHGLLTNPPHLDEASTAKIIIDEWQVYLKRFPSKKFEKRIIDIGPVRTDYLGYITKWSTDTSDSSKGLFDKNTYLPEEHHH